MQQCGREVSSNGTLTVLSPCSIYLMSQINRLQENLSSFAVKESKRNHGTGVEIQSMCSIQTAYGSFFVPGNHSLMEEWLIAEVRKINDVYKRFEHTNLCQEPETLLHMCTLHCCILLRNEGPRTVRTVLFCTPCNFQCFIRVGGWYKGLACHCSVSVFEQVSDPGRIQEEMLQR